MTQKLEFGSNPWVDKARSVLKELVAEHGQEGKAFSVCEVFTEAPVTIATRGVVAWHFYIDGHTVRVGTGEVDDTDVKICADYAETLPNARLVYTPEVLADRAQNPPSNTTIQVEGDMSLMPEYLIDMHNQMAVLTA